MDQWRPSAVTPKTVPAQPLEVDGGPGEGHRGVDGERRRAGLRGGLQHREAVAARDVRDQLTLPEGARLHQLGDQRAERVVADGEQQAGGATRHVDRGGQRHVGQESRGACAGGLGARGDGDDVVPRGAERGAEHRADATGADDTDLETAVLAVRGLPEQGSPGRGCSHNRSSPCGVPDVPGQRNSADTSQDSLRALTRSRAVMTVTGGSGRRPRPGEDGVVTTWAEAMAAGLHAPGSDSDGPGFYVAARGPGTDFRTAATLAPDLLADAFATLVARLPAGVRRQVVEIGAGSGAAARRARRPAAVRRRTRRRRATSATAGAARAGGVDRPAAGRGDGPAPRGGVARHGARRRGRGRPVAAGGRRGPRDAGAGSVGGGRGLARPLVALVRARGRRPAGGRRPSRCCLGRRGEPAAGRGRGRRRLRASPRGPSRGGDARRLPARPRHPPGARTATGTSPRPSRGTPCSPPYCIGTRSWPAGAS